MCLLVHFGVVIVSWGTNCPAQSSPKCPPQQGCVHIQGQVCDQSWLSILTSGLRGGAGTVEGLAGTEDPCEATPATGVFLGEG